MIVHYAAELIETLIPKRDGQHLSVYRLSTPIKAYEHAGNKRWTYVIVSAVPYAYDGLPVPETYIFGAKNDGNTWDIADYAELPGSFAGAMSHDEALEKAGYKIIDRHI